MKHIRSTGSIGLAWIAAFVTCTEGDRAERLSDPGGLRSGGGTGNPSRPEAPDASVGGASVGGTGGVIEQGPVTNCGDLICRGAGQCSIEGGVATCVCDAGYVLQGDACVVDETCIKLRLLEPGCRQYRAREPALAMFFNVETCAGTTVLPENLGDTSQAFKVLEDGNDLGSESYATVFDRDVESFVAIALDLSRSVTDNSGLLDSLITSVIGLVDDLEPEDGGGAVSVALLVFGRSVGIDVPFTRNFDGLKGRLLAIKDDPAGVVADPEGTNLNGVVNLGQDALIAALDERRIQTDGAVLGTGTLVTVTDGKDTASVGLHPLEQRLNFISVGVSGEIDDAELTRVGVQGSFLAPEEADRDAAFRAVAQRVAEYPRRAHLIAYCSPAVDGRHTVAATLANREAAANATCSFDASEFGVGNGVCTEAFINGYCSSGEHGCGTFLACGQCPDAGGSMGDLWAFPR
jgi:hypothetical protein